LKITRNCLRTAFGTSCGLGGAAATGTLQLWLRNRNSRRAVKTGNGKVAKRKAEMAGTTQRNATEKCKFPRKGNYKNICWRRTCSVPPPFSPPPFEK